MKKSKYNKIGNLHIFKPDYLRENKKTLLNSNIIKEYLRKRKGRWFYKVHYMKNKFNANSLENVDSINRKIQLKAIEDRYQEMKSEINKRGLNAQSFENNNKIKLSTRNKNFLSVSPRYNKSRSIIFSNICKSRIYEYNSLEKNDKFIKFTNQTTSHSNRNKEINFKENYNFLNDSTTNNLLSLKNKYLNNCFKKLRKRKNIELDSFSNNNIELNYDFHKETRKEIKNYLSNDDISNNYFVILKKIRENNPYLSPSFNRVNKLRKKYNFFRIKDEEKQNDSDKKFLKLKKMINSNIKVQLNNFQSTYTRNIIKKIKRKELTELKLNKKKDINL